MAERRTRKPSSSALRAPESSSLGSMPTIRMRALAVLLKSRITGLNTNVNAACMGTTNLAVASGTANAKFLGTSSPITMENRVASEMPITVPSTGTAASGTPRSIIGPRSSELMAGSKVYPVSRVVRVMPSCALERCVEVIRSALMVGPSRFSPRAARASSSLRSSVTRANSAATNTPVPKVRMSPRPSMIHSFTRWLPAPGSVRGGQGAWVYAWEGHPLWVEPSDASCTNAQDQVTASPPYASAPGSCPVRCGSRGSSSSRSARSRADAVRRRGSGCSDRRSTRRR